MSASVLPVGNIKQVPIGNLPFGMEDYPVVVPHKPTDKGRSGQVLAYLEAVQVRRRARLNQLIDDAGGQTLAIERLGKSQAQLSQLSRGLKPIGETLARDLELAAAKPFGWLDADEEKRPIPKSIAQDEHARKLWGMWPKLSTADRRELCAWAAGALRRRSDGTAADQPAIRTSPRNL